MVDKNLSKEPDKYQNRWTLLQYFTLDRFLFTADPATWGFSTKQVLFQCHIKLLDKNRSYHNLYFQLFIFTIYKKLTCMKMSKWTSLIQLMLVIRGNPCLYLAIRDKFITIHTLRGFINIRETAISHIKCLLTECYIIHPKFQTQNQLEINSLHNNFLKNAYESQRI